MGKKLLFFDIDGTIVTRDHVIPESAVKAIAAAREAGHILMINTGRPYRHVEPQVRALPMSGFVCSIGGHIVLNGQTLLHTELPLDLCRELRDAGYACGLDMLFESEEGVWYQKDGINPIAQRELKWLGSIGVPCFEDTFSSRFRFDKFVCWPGPKGEPERFREQFRDRMTFIFRENSMMEVVSRGLSKAKGMELVMERLSIPREDTFAFGDGPNDLPMLQTAGKAVLMGNAPEELYSSADFVTDRIERDGLAKAMKHFGLI